ncbi:MAG: hypothetical protein AAGK22_15490 [Acidobacteriota bacterium]
MDAQKFREAYAKLQAADDRLTYRVRPRRSQSRLSQEQLEDRTNDLADLVLELKEVLDELFQAIAGKSS